MDSKRKYKNKNMQIFIFEFYIYYLLSDNKCTCTCPYVYVMHVTYNCCRQCVIRLINHWYNFFLIYASGHCKVDETEKGWFIAYIDRDPETIERQKVKRGKTTLN